MKKFMEGKIRGMFLGAAIGDALGMPVESYTQGEILRLPGRITSFLEPKNHKWHGGKLFAGQWTDDTQLTLAIAKSLISKGQIDLDDMAREHIKALEEGDVGWGKSTKTSILKIKNGVHWLQAGNLGGAGNGVAMKIAPIGAFLSSRYDDIIGKFPFSLEALRHDKNIDLIVRLTLMTHRSDMAISSALAQVYAVVYCLKGRSKDFNAQRFCFAACAGAHEGYCQHGYFGDIARLTDNLPRTLEWLRDRTIFGKIRDMTDEDIIKKFNGGTCYVFNSLPFSHAFFLRKPHSIEALYDVVNAGGDTDSNGSIVGSLLGALHGTSIFPKQLIDNLWRKDEIVEIADEFYTKFFCG